jgi:CBS domain containing-hemolysin-like protein
MTVLQQEENKQAAMKCFSSSCATKACDGLRYIFGTVLTLGGLALIGFGIATGQSGLTSNPVAPFIVLVLLLTLMGYCEGVQLALIALKDYQVEDCAETHKRAHRLLLLAKKPFAFEKFLIGRQFTILFVVMLMGTCTSFPNLMRPSFIPQILWTIYVDTALYGSLVVMSFGSLMPQLIGTRSAVFFCNLPGAIWVFRMTLLFEALGVGHFSWLLSASVWRLCRLVGAKENRRQCLASEMQKENASASTISCEEQVELQQDKAGKLVEALRMVADVIRYIGSTVLTLGGVAFICYGIAVGKAQMTPNPVAPFIIFPLSIMLNAYCEGIQLAILDLKGKDGEWFRESHKRAYKIYEMMSDDARVQRFLVGRQFTVIFVFMLISQVTSFPKLSCPDSVPVALWAVYILSTLYQALVVVSFGSLMPQLIATKDPVFFCNLPGCITVLRVLLLLESLGMAHFAWILTAFVQRLCGFRDALSDGEPKKESLRHLVEP